ncbi:hypothetical protein QFC20_006779 [Naganishia adeliensis]|uniref:Uncharacterized protein n=1 Tax=Naganishia adeliensis TaxID=92952 RepID=A0ACC2V7P0_9TREE|nr:hypothetical protein QFC20_006779 [Naganishia adeliensis]
MEQSSANDKGQLPSTLPNYQEAPPLYTILDRGHETKPKPPRYHYRIVRGSPNARRENPYAQKTKEPTFQKPFLAKFGGETQRQPSLKEYDRSTLDESSHDSTYAGTDPPSTGLSDVRYDGADNRSTIAESVHSCASGVPDGSLRESAITNGIHQPTPIAKNNKQVTWQGVAVDKNVWQPVTNHLLGDDGMQKGGIRLDIGSVSSEFEVDWSSAVTTVFGPGFCRKNDDGGVVLKDCLYAKLMWKWDLPWSMEHEADLGLSLRCPYTQQISGEARVKDSGISFAIKLSDNGLPQRVIRNYGLAVKVL